MLVGLFLSKFNAEGLKCLGFKSLTEAFNVTGYALGGKPSSIKNYMQEFDPLFPNGRQGWRGREVRPHCQALYERFGSLPLDEFVKIVSGLLHRAGDVEDLPDGVVEADRLEADRFRNEEVGKRLATGIAAERFFESRASSLEEFQDRRMTNVTRFACGFDYQFDSIGADRPFLAVEVKGLSGKRGSIVMTEKEHRVAEHLGSRFFLCVVSDFAACPSLRLIRAPLTSGLRFEPRESLRPERTWHASVSGREGC